MDPQSHHAVWGFIKEQKTQGKTIILMNHYMEEAEELCDRVGIIDYGKLIALGTPQELIAKAQIKNLEDFFIKMTGRNIREEALVVLICFLGLAFYASAGCVPPVSLRFLACSCVYLHSKSLEIFE